MVAKLADQTPLLLDKKIGEGRVLLLTSTLDNISNDFPISGAFVPFIEQTSRYLAGMSDRNQIYPVGSFVELRSAREQSVSVEIVDPSGARPLSLKDSTTAQSFALTSEGFYELRRANGRHEMIAVNADRRESDLSVIPDETVVLWKNTGSGSAAAQEQQAASGGKASVPYSLWWWFLLALLLVAVAESLFAGRYLGVSREADVNAS